MDAFHRAIFRWREVVLITVVLLHVLPCNAASKKGVAVDTQGTCSCEHPISVPLQGGVSQSPTAGLWLQSNANQTLFYSKAAPTSAQIAAASAASYAAASAAAALLPGDGGMSMSMMSSVPKIYKVTTSGFCGQLPTASAGGQCGAGLAICAQGYCCSQSGFCSQTPAACDGTCQCPYSGVRSGCKGSYPFSGPNPQLLPMSLPGGVCGGHSGMCPPGQCCTQFGFCAADSSVYCLKTSCHPIYSPWSLRCLQRAQSAPIKRFNWVLTQKNRAPDGYSRPVLLVNGAVMVPVNVTVGDRVIVKVVNMLTSPTSIHFHGLLHHGTNAMDGVDGTTQREIMPRESFTYNFIVETPGTYWWHSHHHTQNMDGLFGSVTVIEPTEPNYALDQVVFVQDWYHNTTSDLMASYMSSASMGDEPVPDSALINFKGQAALTAAAKRTVSAYATVKATAVHCDSPRANMTRLRFINSGGFAVFNVSIHNHRLLLVGEDGVLVEEVEVGSFQINNGQRYDVLPCQRPKSGQVSTAPVFIRATMVDANFAYPSPYNSSLAILYFTKSPALPASTADFQPPAMVTDLTGDGYINPYKQRMLGELVPPPANRRIPFVIEMYNEPPTDPMATQYAHVNNISLDMSPDGPYPSLLERYSNNPEAVPPPQLPVSGLGWNIMEIGPAGSDGLMQTDVVDFIINNRDTGEHPIHLHGHWAFVMAAGEVDAGDFADQVELKPSLIRDTVTVNANSFLVLRVIPENPGFWIMHCHIEWHMMAGLGALLKEGFPGASP